MTIFARASIASTLKVTGFITINVFQLVMPQNYFSWNRKSQKVYNEQISVRPKGFFHFGRNRNWPTKPFFFSAETDTETEKNFLFRPKPKTETEKSSISKALINRKSQKVYNEQIQKNELWTLKNLHQACTEPANLNELRELEIYLIIGSHCSRDTCLPNWNTNICTFYKTF